MIGLKNIKLSIFHYIKNIALPQMGYTYDVTEDTLEEVTVGSNVYSFGYSNIAYCDPSGRIDPSGVNIYDVDRLLDHGEYSVNYIENTVTLNAEPSGSVTADYKAHAITVMDAFPTGEVFETADLPIVSVEIDESTDSPFAIGTNENFWDILIFFDIFAINDGQRMDLRDCIQKSLKGSIPIIDFSSQVPLNYDGTINENFNLDNQTMVYRRFRARTVGRNTESPTAAPEKERWRAIVRGILRVIS